MRRFLILILFITVSSLIFKARSEYSLEDLFELGIPVMEVITENDEDPGCDMVSAPEGCIGQSITNDKKIPGSVTLYDSNGEIMYSSGPYKKNDSGMTIKVRGNTSALNAKKHYKIKLQKKADLLCRGDKKYNDKNWVLLNDRLMKIFFGFNISRFIEQDWTPAFQYVNLIMNGTFRGIYMLAEGVERNTGSRINVDESGFIVEHDPYWWNENGEYLPSNDSPLFNYTLKYPDFEDLSDTQKSYISQTMAEYESSIQDGTYTERLDLESLAKWIMGHDIMGTWDGAGANLYYCKYDDSEGSLLKAGPLWDFDTVYENSDKWSGPHTFRFTSLFENENNEFLKAYVNLWNQKGENIFESIFEMLRSLKDGSMNYLDKSLLADTEIWNKKHVSVEDKADMAYEWYMPRYQWMSSQMEKLNMAGLEIVEDDDLFKLSGNQITLFGNNSKVCLYSLDGRLIFTATGGEGQSFTIENPGFYILRINEKAVKLRIR